LIVANAKLQIFGDLPKVPVPTTGVPTTVSSILPPVIHTIDRDGTERWFDLNGRQLSGKPTQEGIYINKGNKVAIK